MNKILTINHYTYVVVYVKVFVSVQDAKSCDGKIVSCTCNTNIMEYEI
jgi:hypothetical protein